MSDSGRPFKPLPWWADIGTTIMESVGYVLGLMKIVTSAAMIEAQSEINTIASNFQNIPLSPALLAAQTSQLAPVALIRKGQRFALVPFDATAERRQKLLTALEK